MPQRKIRPLISAKNPRLILSVIIRANCSGIKARVPILGGSRSVVTETADVTEHVPPNAMSRSDNFSLTQAVRRQYT